MRLLVTLYKNTNKEINWPCIIKHSNDAELIYVSNQKEWDDDGNFHCFEYDEADSLIDSSGETYSLTTRLKQQVKPKLRGETMALQNILDLVKAHATLSGSCCSAKLYAPTISEAFNIVKSLD